MCRTSGPCPIFMCCRCRTHGWRRSNHRSNGECVLVAVCVDYTKWTELNRFLVCNASRSCPESPDVWNRQGIGSVSRAALRRLGYSSAPIPNICDQDTKRRHCRQENDSIRPFGVGRHTRRQNAFTVGSMVGSTPTMGSATTPREMGARGRCSCTAIGQYVRFGPTVPR